LSVIAQLPGRIVFKLFVSGTISFRKRAWRAPELRLWYRLKRLETKGLSREDKVAQLRLIWTEPVPGTPKWDPVSGQRQLNG
jgi:hypothetical protein